MKKILLSFVLATLATSSLSAESITYVFDFSNPGAPEIPYTLSPQTFAELKADPTKYTSQGDATKYRRMKLTGESIQQGDVTITPTTTGADWPRFFFNAKANYPVDTWNWDGETATECHFDCDFRIYKNTTLKFEALNGYITKIVFTGYQFNSSTFYEFQNVLITDGTPGAQTITPKATKPYTNTWEYAEGLNEVNFIVPATAGTQICRKITVTVDDKTNAIDDLTVDSDNVAHRYYDLQGREVTNPVSGIYVKVSGSKVSKIVL